MQSREALYILPARYISFANAAGGIRPALSFRGGGVFLDEKNVCYL